jgi:hypothetical protein
MTATEFFEYIKGEDPSYLLPPMVDEAYLTLAEFAAVTSLGRLARDLDSEVRRTADEANWDRAVKSAYVSVDGEIAKEGAPPIPEAVTNRVLDAAKERIRQASGPITHYLGCYLFDNPKPQAFTIGPVEFMPGTDLPSRIARECGSRPKWFDDYEKLQQDPHLAELRERTRLHPHADDVYYMSRLPWVAAVRVEGYEPSMSQRRATDAARLAIGGLALNLHPNSSRAMSLINEWGRPLVTRTMLQAPGRDVAVGVRNNRPQVHASGEVKELMQSQSEYLAWLGELVSEAIANAKHPRRLRDGWLNALYWYQIACSEASDARATICFSTSIESLSLSIGAQAIIEWLENILDLDRGKIVAPNLRWTLEEAVGEIYEAARSEAVHGGRFIIFQEYQRQRGLAAELCRYVLLLYSTIA